MPPDKKKILIIDDDEPILTMIKVNIIYEGYPVETALDGQSAIDILENDKDPYGLFISDYMYPGREEFIDYKQENFPDVPVLGMTANIDKPEIVKQELGAVYVIRKPFDVDKFIFAVNKYALQ